MNIRSLKFSINLYASPKVLYIHLWSKFLICLITLTIQLASYNTFFNYQNIQVSYSSQPFPSLNNSVNTFFFSSFAYFHIYICSLFILYKKKEEKTKIQIDQLNFDWILNEITFDSKYIILGPSYHLRKYKILVLDTFIKKKKKNSK